MTLGDFVHLRAEVLEEIEGLERVAALLRKRASGRIQRAAKGDQDIVVIRGIAGLLQDYYSGAERVFRRIALEVDEHLPKGESWHRDLPAQMKRDIPGMRPPVISHGTFARLDELRTFRHLVGNYTATT